MRPVRQTCCYRAAVSPVAVGSYLTAVLRPTAGGNPRAKALFLARLAAQQDASLDLGLETQEPAALLTNLPEVERLLADRGHDADWSRDALKDKGINSCIPGQKSRGKPVKHEAPPYQPAHEG